MKEDLNYFSKLNNLKIKIEDNKKSLDCKNLIFEIKDYLIFQNIRWPQMSLKK
jgi:hypothetical protein